MQEAVIKIFPSHTEPREDIQMYLNLASSLAPISIFPERTVRKPGYKSRQLKGTLT